MENWIYKRRRTPNENNYFDKLNKFISENKEKFNIFSNNSLLNDHLLFEPKEECLYYLESYRIDIDEKYKKLLVLVNIIHIRL